MDSDLQRLQETALGEIQQAHSKIALENLRVKFLGKAGAVSRLSENMRNVPKEDRPRIGKLLNEIRNGVTVALDSRLVALESEGEAQNLSDVDETLPGNAVSRRRHTSVDTPSGTSGANSAASGICAGRRA